MDIITVVFFLLRHLQTGRKGQNKKKNKDHCTGLMRWRDWLNPPADWLNPLAPPNIPKRVGLEKPGVRLISSNDKT